MSRLYISFIKTSLLIALLFSVTACGSASAAPTPVPPTALPATATLAPTATSVPTQPTTAEVAPQANEILTVIAQATGLERFVTLLESAGLAEQLQGAGPMTVFIVPNIAWDELPPAVLNNADLMRQILLAHLVEGQHLMADMTAAGKIQSLQGDELTVLAGAEGGTVQGANVLDADYEAANGIIHLLDTVLLPSASITDVMALYPSTVGEQTYAMQGNIHITHGTNSPVAYTSVPPTSGPHYGDIVAWQLYTNNFPYEQLVHNLEDGGVILYYQCATACPDLVEQLRTVAQPYFDAERHVVVAPNDPTWTQPDGAKPHQDMGAPIAVVAWRKMLKLDEVDAEKITQFIETYEGTDHHVK